MDIAKLSGAFRMCLTTFWNSTVLLKRWSPWNGWFSALVPMMAAHGMGVSLHSKLTAVIRSAETVWWKMSGTPRMSLTVMGRRSVLSGQKPPGWKDVFPWKVPLIWWYCTSAITLLVSIYSVEDKFYPNSIVIISMSLFYRGEHVTNVDILLKGEDHPKNIFYK